MYGNYVFRHVLLECGADFVFTEMIGLENLDKEFQNNKFALYPEDAQYTIPQLLVATEEEIEEGLELFDTYFSECTEYNLNMDCSHSSMLKKGLGGGLLLNEEQMGKMTKAFSQAVRSRNKTPSAKIRIGVKNKEMKIKRYLRILSTNGIQKVYIHTRPVRYPYEKPALYDPLVGLKKVYPDMEIVANGDVDSFESFSVLSEKAHCDGVAIGRAALVNPLIFEQIKKGLLTRGGKYNPFLKDPNIIRHGGTAKLTQEKKAIIERYIRYAKEKEVRMKLVKNTLHSLTKGLTYHRAFKKAMNASQTLEEIEASFTDYCERYLGFS
jgi:tRNA-dihydrouridine synthase